MFELVLTGVLSFIVATVIAYFVGNYRFIEGHRKRIFLSISAFVSMHIFSMVQARITGTGGAPETEIWVHFVGWAGLGILTLLPLGIAERISKQFDANDSKNWLLIGLFFWIALSATLDVLIDLVSGAEILDFNIKIVIVDILAPAIVAAVIWWKCLPPSQNAQLDDIFRG